MIAVLDKKTKKKILLHPIDAREQLDAGLVTLHITDEDEVEEDNEDEVEEDTVVIQEPVPKRPVRQKRAKKQ